MTANILRAGALTSVQDCGRTGYRAIGVGMGGALDSFGARVANLLAGNDTAAALLEVTLGNFRIQFNDERSAAWCGGSFDVTLDEEQIPAGHLFRVAAGEALDINTPESGCRVWLAIFGGINVPLALGSRSTDLRAGFGGLDGRALRDGDELPLGKITQASGARLASLRGARCSDWSAPHEWTNTGAPYPSLRVIRGADWSRFQPDANDALFSEVFEVTPEADRMGIRLHGPQLKRHEARDLLSEAVTPGTIQVPPNGHPILLLGDCQTIGGYPKIAHVITVDLPIAAQLRPGNQVRFREVSVEVAHRLFFERERELERFRIGLSLRAR